MNLLDLVFVATPLVLFIAGTPVLLLASADD
jgi:hypothetical protein